MLVMKSNKPAFAYPSLIDRFFDREVSGVFGKDMKSVIPDVNILKTEDAFQLEIAAPGLKKEDFQITLEKDKLTISANVKKENEELKNAYLRKEFNYRSFSRSFILSNNIYQDEISATYENGILLVNLPLKKVDNSNVLKKISID